MRSFLRWLFLLPIAIAALLFANVNRNFVTVSFDLLPATDYRGPQVETPLFLVVIAAIILGVMLGGALVWLRQGRHRKAARAATTEAERLRSETEGLRARLAVSPGPLPPARADLP
jgi:uncharacterized integral membrane protein